MPTGGRCWVFLVTVIALSVPAMVAASDPETLGPVLVAPLQGSEELRAAHEVEVDEALRIALRARGIVVVEADPVLGHALVACQSRECVEQALAATGAEASVVPALWARGGGGEELTLTLVRGEGRNLNASGRVEGEVREAVAPLVDALLAARIAVPQAAGASESARPKRPSAWKAGPIVLIAGGAAVFVAIGVGAATKGEQQQLNTTAVAVWSAVGAAAIAGGVAWWVVGAKRRRAVDVALGPAKIDLRLRF